MATDVSEYELMREARHASAAERELAKARKRRVLVWLCVAALLAAAVALAACAPNRPETSEQGKAIPEGTIDPAVWGKEYPTEYEMWQATKETRATGSKYKRGGERTEEYDKLSEYPFLAAMTAGLGFSVEFNEPRGHWYAIIDQNRIDPARLKPGGVCLACKSPYYEKLRQEQGDKLYPMPYKEAQALIPEEFRELGPACIDCHEPKDMSLKVAADYAREAMDFIKLDEGNREQMENMACGQCHSTYVVTKTEDTKDGKSNGLFLPWNRSEYGDISVEDIIASIEATPTNHEWTQALTGFRLGYIRHPEFELYTRNSTHSRNGVTCPDCHMPFKIEDDTKAADHNMRSPLDDGMRACTPCHTQSPQELKDAVITIQDRTIGTIMQAGYSVVADAQLFRMLHSEAGTETAQKDERYGDARRAYTQAFYRVAYLTAENSVGFHNSGEAQRIGADALAYSERAETLLRQMLSDQGVKVPAEVDLNLRQFLENRGERKLQFEPEQEFKDPTGIAEELWRRSLEALRSGAATGTGGSEP